MEKNDFIEFNYTGKTQNGFVFDTTIESVAKTAQMNPKQTYKPVIMCLGHSQFLPGLDEALIGKDVGKYEIGIEAEKAFGKKDASLIQTVPLSKFKKDGLEPYPGMQINVDGQIASVKRVSGGRVLVDRNHPLSGVDVVYDVEIIRKVTDTKEKVESYIMHNFGNVKHDIKNDTLTMYVQSLPDETLQEAMKQQLIAIIPELKDVAFVVEKAEASTQAKANKKEE